MFIIDQFLAVIEDTNLRYLDQEEIPSFVKFTKIFQQKIQAIIRMRQRSKMDLTNRLKLTMFLQSSVYDLSLLLVKYHTQ